MMKSQPTDIIMSTSDRVAPTKASIPSSSRTTFMPFSYFRRSLNVLRYVLVFAAISASLGTATSSMSDDPSTLLLSTNRRRLSSRRSLMMSTTSLAGLGSASTYPRSAMEAGSASSPSREQDSVEEVRPNTLAGGTVPEYGGRLISSADMEPVSSPPTSVQSDNGGATEEDNTVRHQQRPPASSTAYHNPRSFPLPFDEDSLLLRPQPSHIPEVFIVNSVLLLLRVL